jgi:hypothetical protein
MTDTHIINAAAQVDAVKRGSIRAPHLTAFFDEPTFNIRAGHLPPPEENGVRYLKLPLDQL